MARSLIAALGSGSGVGVADLRGRRRHADQAGDPLRDDGVVGVGRVGDAVLRLGESDEVGPEPRDLDRERDRVGGGPEGRHDLIGRRGPQADRIILADRWEEVGRPEEDPVEHVPRLGRDQVDVAGEGKVPRVLLGVGE